MYLLFIVFDCFISAYYGLQAARGAKAKAKATAAVTSTDTVAAVISPSGTLNTQVLKNFISCAKHQAENGKTEELKQDAQAALEHYNSAMNNVEKSQILQTWIENKGQKFKWIVVIKKKRIETSQSVQEGITGKMTWCYYHCFILFVVCKGIDIAQGFTMSEFVNCSFMTLSTVFFHCR